MPRPECLSSLILRPSVVLLLAWATCATAWLLLAFSTAPTPAPGEPWRFLAPRTFVLGTLVQVLLAVLLALDLRLARRAPIGLRRTQVVSGVAALALLAQLQVLGSLAFAGGTF